MFQNELFHVFFVCSFVDKKKLKLFTQKKHFTFEHFTYKRADVRIKHKNITTNGWQHFVAHYFIFWRKIPTAWDNMKF